MEEVLGKFTSYIKSELRKEVKEPFDAREICAKYTTDVVSSCIFNADAESFTKEKPEIREMGRKIMEPTALINMMFLLYTIFPFLVKVLKVKMVSKEVEDFFSNLIFQAIKLREKNKVKRNDYLAYLIELSKKKQLSELDIAAHGVSFFIGKKVSAVFANLLNIFIFFFQRRFRNEFSRYGSCTLRGKNS